MTKWDIHIYDRVHPYWDTPFQTPFPDHSHSTWFIWWKAFSKWSLILKIVLKTNKLIDGIASRK